MASRIGKGDEGVGIAAFALALAGVKHGAGERAHHATRPRLGGEVHPRLGAERFEHVLVVVERMAGEEEADRLELARQPVGRHPRLGGAKLDRGRHLLGAGKQIVLALGACLQRPVAGRDQAVDIGEGRGAVEAKLIKGAGGGKRLERALVDQARIDAPREVRDVAERSAASRSWAICSTAWRPTFFSAASE